MERKDFLAEKLRKKESYQESSRERLGTIASKKMDTIMIGCLDIIEKRLGFLWGKGENRELTDEERQLRDIYQEIRKDVLDIGNNQKRNFLRELDNNTVEWQRYHMDLPVRPEGPQGRNE